MKNMARSLLFILLVTTALCSDTLAHQAFTLVSKDKLTVTAAQLADLQRQASVGKIKGSDLTYSEADIKLVATTGPEDDMLSFRIQGVRNPNIVTPGDVRITVWFVNLDGDMPHDLLFAHYPVDFPVSPDVNGAVGTERLAAHEDPNSPIMAEKIVIQSNEDGAYRYFCSVRGHAKGGMWGNILVGVSPTPGLPMPTKPTHVHTADEEKMEDMPGMKPAPTPEAGHQHNMPMPSPTATPDNTSSMPGMNMPGMKRAPTPTPRGGHEHDMAGMDMPGSMGGMQDHHMAMSSTVNVGDPMEREASGTAWNPDSSPVYARMKMAGGGMWMFMGLGFVRYTDVGSSRDVSVAGKGDRARFDAPTMFMAMYSHPVRNRGQFGFRGMLSLDPAIERPWGYPLLYQTGEVYEGQSIHDRQHPHDLFSELAVTYSYKFSDSRSFYIYGGLPGEPALGPPMYLHRVSGMSIPDAPIGHHWQDATHITYGVITAGYSLGKAKLETSIFNGREPDENRWNIDRPRLNSYSARLSVNPTKNLALQISHGYLRDPERAEPQVRILRRTTASAIYNKKLADDRNWATTLLWGQNYANAERSDSFLVESDYGFGKSDVFGRYERVNKSGHDLVLSPPLEHEKFWLNVFKLGYLRDVVQGKGIDLGIGGMFTVDHNPQALAPVYGGATHAGWQLYMRFRPSRYH